MDKLPTVDTRQGLALAGTGLAGLVLAVGSCDFSDTPDPRKLAEQTPPPIVRAIEQVITPASGDLAGVERPAAAPMLEVAGPSRSVRPDNETIMIVVGRNAASTFDAKLRRAFEGSLEDTRCRDVRCTDREAIELLMIGRADFGLIGGKLSQREVQAGLRQTPIGIELFALSVSPLSSVRSLTKSQVRQIFTGQVTDWQQLGFDAGAIVPVIPSERTLAERAERTLIPGDRFASTCIAVSSERHVADQILQHRGAIGIIRMTAEPRELGQKQIQIDWTPPTAAAFGYGTYPFGIPLQLVTSGRPDSMAEDFLYFARSEKGRSMLARTLTFAN